MWGYRGTCGGIGVRVGYRGTCGGIGIPTCGVWEGKGIHVCLMLAVNRYIHIILI